MLNEKWGEKIQERNEIENAQPNLMNVCVCVCEKGIEKEVKSCE